MSWKLHLFLQQFTICNFSPDVILYSSIIINGLNLHWLTFGDDCLLSTDSCYINQICCFSIFFFVMIGLLIVVKIHALKSLLSWHCFLSTFSVRTQLREGPRKAKVSKRLKNLMFLCWRKVPVANSDRCNFCSSLSCLLHF